MTINPSPIVERLLHHQLARGGFSSENEVLEEALRTLAEKQEREETIRAVREGVADAEAGRVSTVDEVFDRIDAELRSLKRNR
jgi:putative addiction module CopG family antidote